MSNRKVLWILFLLVCSASAFAASPNYSVIKKIPIPGSGGWDYLAVDDGARRLYVSHATEVEILDLDSGQQLGSIRTMGMHGIAIAPEFNHGFLSDGKANIVIMFDLKTMKVLSKIDSPQNPDGIIYDDGSKRVFAFNGESNSATAIDAASGKVAGTVDLGGGPEYAAADGRGYVFNNLEDESLVLAINSRTLKIEQRWPTSPCSSPSSMAMDRTNRRIFIGCRSKVMAVLDADSGKVITTLPIGDHVDATVFDAERKLIFNSNGEGTITVIRQTSPDTYSVVQTVKTAPRAKTMAFDPKTHRIFLSTAENGQFEVLVVGQ
jgi:DNA-binding beta-propeller fold protein YncE